MKRLTIIAGLHSGGGLSFFFRVLLGIASALPCFTESFLNQVHARASKGFVGPTMEYSALSGGS
jgi:hypothetical protein